MGSKKTKTTSQETATTTPNVPGYAQEPVSNYFQQVSAFGQKDPNQYVTPANANQQSAFSGAGGLFQASPYFQQAADATAQNMGGAAPQAQLTQAQMAQMPGAYMLDPEAFKNLAQAGGASASLAGPAAQMQAAQLGNAQSYDPSQVGLTDLGNTAQQAQAQSLLTNFNDYLNPATQHLVNTTLGSFDDNAARLRAEQQRQAARTGAFGGSNNAILQAQTERDLAAARALTEAQLQDTAFTRALGASQYDAGNRQQAELFNTGAQNQRDEYIAGLNQQAGMFNTDARNQAGMFNTNAANDFMKTQAGFNQQAGMFNTGAQNDVNLTNAQLGTQANIANAANQTQANLANAQGQMNAMFANQGALNQYGLAGFNAANDFSQFNAGAANQNSQFNAGMDMQNQGLNLQAAGQLANIAGAGSQDYMNNLNALLGLGNAQWDMDNMANQADLTHLQNQANLLNSGLLGAISGQTINSSGTSTSKQSGGLLGSILGPAATLGSAAIMKSERRVKRDINLLGREPDGMGWYDFRYVWDADDEPLRRGVMVDEVERIRPWALGPVVDGVQTVNYGAL